MTGHREGFGGTIRALFFALLFACVGCNANLGKKKGEDDSPARVEDECAEGSLSCGGACVFPLSDSNHCGTCGNVCAEGQYCEAGVCTGYCTLGETDCAGACLVTVSDPQNCGGCGLVCPTGQFCDQGLCSATCSGSQCLSATGVNQCVHHLTNNDHCGACGITCPDGQQCENGACALGCPAGRLRCGSTCVDPRTDALNCGSCGVACAGSACAEGQCGGGEPVCTGTGCSCTAEQTDCGGTCINTGSNPLHCGACGKECGAEFLCQGGLCVCSEGKTQCGATCSDTLTDNANCGLCGTVCSGGTTCQGGSCECAAEQTFCTDTCVDTQTDAEHCGACGTVCETYESCVSGICKYDGDQCGGDARNLNLTRVALYQAVELDLFSGGSVLSPEERAVDVVQNRRALARVFVEPGAGFVSRELSARIFVENGGTIEVFHQKRTVSGASSQNSLSSTFTVELPASALQENTNYWIELVECGVLPEGTVGTVRVPAVDVAPLNARETGPLKIVFVPVRHDNRVPDTSTETIAAYAAEVQNLYPSVEVVASVRDAITSAQSGTSVDLGGILNQVTEQREIDVAPEDVYYYGLIDPASSFNTYCNGGCTTGVGWVTDADGWWAAGHRAAVGIGFGNRGVGTFAHELGHNHGRNHAPCGGASGTDSSYPHSGAYIGTWGYDFLTGELIDPTEYRDFMSYCGPEWVSDYSYQAYIERIASVNGVSAQTQQESKEPPVTWYRMTVSGGGASWSTPVTGRGAPGAHAEAGEIYDAGGNVIAHVSVYRIVMSHGGGYMLYVPAPRSGWVSVGLPGGPVLAY